MKEKLQKINKRGLYGRIRPRLQELNQCYPNLNHDRYKSYFNYFIILHLGLITAIGSDFSREIHCFRQFLIFIGIILAIAWFLVQYKIQRDIEEVWHIIENYEKSDKYCEVIRISEARWKCSACWSASKLMLVIPVCFFFTYCFIVAKIMCS